MATYGAVYIATGEMYNRWALHSIASLRKLSDIPITIFTDAILPLAGSMKITQRPIEQDDNWGLTKLRALRASPYDQTVFFDSDTEILSRPEDVMWFNFDIAAAKDMSVDYDKKLFLGYNPGHLNTGVIFYRMNDRVINVLDEAIDRYNEIGEQEGWTSDQSVLNHLIFNRDINVQKLSPEWNVRSSNFKLVARPKVIHMHHLPDLPRDKLEAEWEKWEDVSEQANANKN